MKIAGFLALSALFLSFQQERPLLRVELSNIRNQKGVVLLSVYSNEKEYPYNPFRTYEVKKDSLRDGQLSTTIRDLSPGEYAMCVLDDENRSGGMEYNFLGIPSEGFGFANNVKPFIKRPDYDRCLFTIKSGPRVLGIIVRYKN